MVRVAVGIAAYNEAKNIGRLLDRLVKEPLLDEIVVVASGCTDDTVAIAQGFPGVKVLVQERREGKASAINLFLDHTDAEIVILESADTLPGHWCIRHLLAPFEDPAIGMVGARPIPVNSIRSVMGKVAHLLWRSHHRLSMRYPKAGEVVAFRRVMDSIDPETPVDEASIEQQIVRQGLRVAYEPKAIIFNKGAETLKDLTRQRRRIYHGHLLLWRGGYTVATMKARHALTAVLASAERSAKGIIALVLFCAVEGYCRLMAHFDMLMDRGQYTVWEMTTTTKELIGG